jgi:hypothetical protein
MHVHTRACARITVTTINIRGEKISSYTCYRLINPTGLSLSALNPFTLIHIRLRIRPLPSDFPKLADYTLIHAIHTYKFEEDLNYSTFNHGNLQSYMYIYRCTRTTYGINIYIYTISWPLYYATNGTQSHKINIRVMVSPI